MEIGDILKRYRKINKYTQEYIKVETGISHYGEIERNKVEPTILTLERICEVLKVDLIEVMLCKFNKGVTRLILTPQLNRAISKFLLSDIYIRLNRGELRDLCEKSIWYNGFIASAYFEEFEMRIIVQGNVRGSLYLNEKLVLTLNSEEAGRELYKYFDTDEELDKILEVGEYDEEILRNKKGNVLFIQETNWFLVQIINSETNEIQDQHILDHDKLSECLGTPDIFFDYLWRQ